MLGDITRGDDTTIKIIITDENGDRLPIAGSTIWITLKENKSDSDDNAILQKIVTSHTDPSNGVSSIWLSSTDTDLVPKSYHYDVQIKLDSGIIKTIEMGRVKVNQDITLSTS